MRYIFYFFLFILLIPNLVFAVDNSNQKINHHIYLGLLTSYFDYSESVPSDEEGIFAGINLGYEFLKPNCIYMKLDTVFAGGELEYNGKTWGGSSLSFDHDDFIVDLEYDFGFNVQIKDFYIIPFIGFSYHFWARNLSDSPAGYDEKYNWICVPIGAIFGYNFTDCFNIQLKLNATPMVYGQVQAFFSDINDNFNDPRLELGNKTGYKSELCARLKIYKHWAVMINPFFEYYEFGKSDNEKLEYSDIPVDIIYEPASETYKIGINFLVTFMF